VRSSTDHSGWQAGETAVSHAHTVLGLHDESELVPSEGTHSGIIVPHAELLFSGDFKRSGEDLVISRFDEKFTVSNYYRGEHHSTLFSPEGASISGDIVDALTGHSVYAQAGPADSSAAPIGHVVKVSGNATAIRNGVAVELHVGDNVFKGDAVQSGSDSLLGISFIDGTAFSLSSNARMVLNEMVYDPLGSSNSSLLSLIQGNISFVAGQSAKNGVMKVDTPVATMGIRGTAVLVEISADNGPTNFSVLVEPGQVTGSFVLYDKETGDTLGSVSQAGLVTAITPNGAHHFTLSEHLKTPAELQAEADLVQQVFSIAFPKFNLNDTDPHSTSGSIGSGATPFESLAFYPITTFQLSTNQLPAAKAAFGPSATQVTVAVGFGLSQVVGETNPASILVPTLLPAIADVLPAGQSVNSLGLASETFQELTFGNPANNGAGTGNFYSAILGATFSATGDAGITNGTSGVSAAPFIGSGPDTANYLSIGGNATETIVFNSEQNAFGLYWGSVDSFNTVAFYEGSQLVASYSGSDVNPLFPQGIQTSLVSNGYVEFSNLGSFDKVVLSSTQNAFEIASISAGFLSSSQAQPIGPVSGTVSAVEGHGGQILTAMVEGNASILYDGGAMLPSGAIVAPLVAAAAISFDSVTANVGVNVLNWTYDPTGANLDFLKPGDILTITYTADITDGIGNNLGTEPLTVTIVGGPAVDSTPPETGLTIASGAALELNATAAALGQSVTFAASTGVLTLDSPSSFTGLISGFSGNGTLSGSDQIDLKNIDFTSGSFSDSFNQTTDTLSVSDGTNAATIHFEGTYVAANFQFVSDGDGGTIVYDPPVASSPSSIATASTIVVNPSNQAVTGHDHPDVFAWSIANIGQTTINHSHSATESLQFNSSTFATVQATLAAIHHDGYGNVMDAHTAMPLMDVGTAHLHTGGFHIV
jgi:hypothetical protein